MTWETQATSFAWTVHDGRLLAVLHERLGTELWEVPGGHVEHGETFEEAAARETLEETGVSIQVGRLVATCMHEWLERRQRRLILFFAARPAGQSIPRPGDEGVRRAEWVDPTQLAPDLTSPFLHPLLNSWSELNQPQFEPLTFRAVHRLNADGRWLPQLVEATRDAG